MGRVIRELDAVKQEAALLQDQMKMVKEDIQKVWTFKRFDHSKVMDIQFLNAVSYRTFLIQSQ